MDFVLISLYFSHLQACSGDVPDNFPSQSTSDTGLSIRDDLLESVLSESVIIGSAEVIPDIAVQPHTLQQEFALINVNIPNVIVEQVKRGLSLSKTNFTVHLYCSWYCTLVSNKPCASTSPQESPSVIPGKIICTLENA